MREQPGGQLHGEHRHVDDQHHAEHPALVGMDGANVAALFHVTSLHGAGASVSGAEHSSTPTAETLTDQSSLIYWCP